MYMLCQKPVWSERTHCAQQALIVIRQSGEVRYQDMCPSTPHTRPPPPPVSPTYLGLGKVQSGGQVESVRAHHVLRSGSNYGFILSIDSHQTYFRNSSSRNSSCSGVKIVLILLVLILLPPPSLLKSSKK